MPTFGGIGFGGGGAKNANFTNTATGTYSSGGKNYKYILFTGNGTLTVDREGAADALVVGGGCFWSGDAAQNNGARINYGTYFLPIGNHTVTVGGAAGINALSGASSLGNISYAGQIGNSYANQYGSGAGGGRNGYTTTITGSSLTVASATQFSGYGSPGSAGCVIVRVEI